MKTVTILNKIDTIKFGLLCIKLVYMCMVFIHIHCIINIYIYIYKLNKTIKESKYANFMHNSL